MAVKKKHLMPILLEGQQMKVFTNNITSDDLMHIVIGTFRLQMFQWRVANFQFDIVKSGNRMIEAILNLIKT